MDLPLPKVSYKIGIDARLWNETGVGRYIRNLFHYLSKLDKTNQYVWFFREREYKEITMPSSKWWKVKVDIGWHGLAEQCILPSIFLKENLDLLHVPYFSFPVFYHRPFVVTISDLIFDHFKNADASTLPLWTYWIKKVGYHFIVWLTTRRAKIILTLSRDAQSEIISHYSVDKSKIVVTYEAGNLEDSPTNSSQNNYSTIEKFRPYLLYVGNAHPHKNVETLILALKEIRKEIHTIKLILLGDDNFFYPRLKIFVQNQNLDDHVIFQGQVPNSQLGAWYKYADCFVSPSKMEGFGIPALEAMSNGCPVIVSEIPVFREIYADAAMYFDPNNSQDIARVIVNTLKNKSLNQTMIKRGYKKAREYSWEKTAKETLAVYRKALSD